MPAETAAPGRDVKVVDEAGIVGDDKVEIARSLQGADDRVVGALQDADHPSLAARRLGRTPEPPFALRRRLGDQPGHDAVAMHRRKGVLRADEKVRLAGRFSQHMRGTARVKLNRTGHQIRIFGNDVAVLADAGHLAAHFHVAQQFAELPALLGRQAQRLRDLDFIERPLSEKSEDARPQIVFSAFSG